MTHCNVKSNGVPFFIIMALVMMGCPEQPAAGPESFCAGSALSLNALPTITSGRGSDTGSSSGAVLVTYRPGALPSTPDLDASMPAVQHRYENFGIIEFRPGTVSPTHWATLMADPRVQAVEDNRATHIRGGGERCTPPATGAEAPVFSVTALGADAYWPRFGRGTAVRVAVLDTGIDTAHPDLIVSDGINVSGLGAISEWSDDHGHGTHVAGIIGAKANGEGVIGVAPESVLLAVKTQDARGDGTTATLVAGINWAIEHNAQVVNMSLGAAGASYAEQRAVDTAAAQGLIMVAASGNGGDIAAGDANDVEYPAAYRNVISVGALNQDFTPAQFSTFNTMVDLTAPGTTTLSTQLGGAYSCDNGTSFSTPAVSGLAALLRAAFPLTTSFTLKRALVCTATDLDLPGIDVYAGYGLPNASTAAEAITDPRMLSLCEYLQETPLPFPEGAPDPEPMPSWAPEDAYFRMRVQSLSTLFYRRGEASGAVLRGQVLSHIGEPVGDAALGVALYNEVGELVAEVQAVTDEAGSFAVFAQGASCGVLIFHVQELTREGYLFDSGASITRATFSF